MKSEEKNNCIAPGHGLQGADHQKMLCEDFFRIKDVKIWNIFLCNAKVWREVSLKRRHKLDYFFKLPSSPIKSHLNLQDLSRTIKSQQLYLQAANENENGGKLNFSDFLWHLLKQTLKSQMFLKTASAFWRKKVRGFCYRIKGLQFRGSLEELGLNSLDYNVNILTLKVAFSQFLRKLHTSYNTPVWQYNA